VLSESQVSRLRKMMLWVGPITTLAISPLWNYDPINPIKVLVVAMVGFTCIGILLPNILKLFKSNLTLCLICLLFFLALLNSFLFSGAPKTQQLWGMFGRGTGLLTYVSLLFILFTTAQIEFPDFGRKLVNSLIYTSYPMTLYCILQIANLDPFVWSGYATFGTLGNVNFLSAFLGMSSIALIVNTFEDFRDKGRLFRNFAISTIQISIIVETDSIQGLIVFAFGLLISLFFLLPPKKYSLRLTYWTVLLTSLVGVSFALFNFGPLAKIVYQETISFRADYMSAAVKIMLHNPLSGVGLDSYGDWYRTERGDISAFRTSFNRTANSAHNIYLDQGANGGVPLLLAFILIQVLVIVSIFRYARSLKTKDFSFISMVAIWTGYQVQAIVSINQIGIGIWGWLLSGALITKFRSENTIVSKPNTKQKFMKNASLPAASAITSIVFFSIAFALAFAPLKTDYDFRQSSSKGDLNGMMAASTQIPSSAFFMAQTVDIALRNNYAEQARTIDDALILKFPRDFYGWQLRRELSPLGTPQRLEAESKLKEIDPYTTLCYETDSVAIIKSKLLKLPSRKQEEILAFWKLENSLESVAKNEGPDFSFLRLQPEVFESRVKQFCGLP